MQRIVPVALVATIAGCVPFGTAGQVNVTATGPGAPTPAPAPRLSYVEGTVYAPAMASAAAYRVAAYAPAQAAGALVQLSSPDEKPYFDHLGRPVATTADDKGRFRLPVEPGKPLVITAITAGDQRLVSFATLAATGAATVDVSGATPTAPAWAARPSAASRT